MADKTDKPLHERRPNGGMRFTKGHAKRGGRGKGTPNKVTRELREAIKVATDYGANELAGWLKRTARKNPAAAAKLTTELLEYVTPKLSRAELGGPNGQPIRTVEVVEYVSGVPRPAGDREPRVSDPEGRTEPAAGEAAEPRFPRGEE